MHILIGTNTDGWNKRGYVSLLPGSATQLRTTLAELAEALKQMGVQRSDIRLAGNDDGSHAMSAPERAEFWTCWDSAF